MKFLHTMIRVGDLDRSLEFFCTTFDAELRSHRFDREGRKGTRHRSIRSKPAQFTTNNQIVGKSKTDIDFVAGTDSVTLVRVRSRQGHQRLEANQLRHMRAGGLARIQAPRLHPIGRVFN